MKLIDLTGQKFNRLTVLSRSPFNSKNGEGEAQWFCQCDCGNYTTVPGYKLRTGRIKSCGCLKRENTSKRSIKTEIGNRYGHLLVVEYVGSSNGYAEWQCLCDCGQKVIVRGSNLRNGNTQSCGCHTLSKGEDIIKTFLLDKNITFIQQKTFSSLVGNSGYYLKFDFFLPKFNTCIEFQGKQHFQSIDYFGGEDEFQKRQLYDQKKTRILLEE